MRHPPRVRCLGVVPPGVADGAQRLGQKVTEHSVFTAGRPAWSIVDGSAELPVREDGSGRP